MDTRYVKQLGDTAVEYRPPDAPVGFTVIVGPPPGPGEAAAG
ncbi:hypothetical protein [Streptomyces sp. NPDC048191]